MYLRFSFHKLDFRKTPEFWIFIIIKKYVETRLESPTLHYYQGYIINFLQITRFVSSNPLKTNELSYISRVRNVGQCHQLRVYLSDDDKLYARSWFYLTNTAICFPTVILAALAPKLARLVTAAADKIDPMMIWPTFLLDDDPSVSFSMQWG